MLLSVVFALCLARVYGDGWGLDNGLARTPQMGWNSWNHYGCNVDAAVLQSTMDSFVSEGLSKHGYNYVNVDDCWVCSRDANGAPVPCPKTFPNGIKSLADYAHTNGLLFGIYSDGGNKTCAGRPGSLGYETIDANTYAAWGVDYLKYDNCNSDNIPPQTRYPVMRDALNQTGRHIFFSMCEWGIDQPWNWAQPVGNSWRTTGDISDHWNSMLSNWDHNGPSNAAAPGGWNDPDMLEVGNGGMTTTEYISHFSLWCAGKAPLLIGCDVSSMSSDTKMILMNDEAIAVNQDSLGKQVTEVYSDSHNWQIYSGPLSNNAVTAIVLNRNAAAITAEVTWKELGLAAGAKYLVRDLWAHSDLGTFADSYTVKVDAHGVSFVKMTPA